MFSGSEIAARIHEHIKTMNGVSVTELGGLLSQNTHLLPKSKRRCYGAFLKKLRQEKIIRELRITAEYLGLPLEYLLLGKIPEDDAPPFRHL